MGQQLWCVDSPALKPGQSDEMSWLGLSILPSFIAIWITFGVAHWLSKFLPVCEELHRCAPSSCTPWSAHLTQGAALEGSACFGGTWQVSAEFTVFATRWKLWFLNVSFFPFFQIQRGAITLFYFTLTSSVLLSAKYFEQSFRCVTTQRCWHLDKAFNFLGRKTWNFNFINVF